MKNSNPLVPEGSLLEQKNQGRARVRIAVFLVLAIHVAGFMALLIVQGCRREQTETTENTGDTNPLVSPTMETTAPATNAPVTPPYVEPPPLVAPVATGQEYIVQKGDSFYTLGKVFGVSIKAIQEANPGVVSTRLKIGQTLHIPAPSAPAPTPTATSPGFEAAAGSETYTVKSGDNLSKIAKQFGVSVKALRAENSLTTDRIVVGKKLKIPAKASAPVPVTAAPEPAPAVAPTPGAPMR